MRTVLIATALMALLAGAGLIATKPHSLSEEDVSAITPDLERGALLFRAGGCSSCHAAEDAEGAERFVLSGGHRLSTRFGTFVTPNISQDAEHGLGTWSRGEIVTALMEGTSPDGRHYYPAFPYAAYAKAGLEDMVSLAAFLETLPEDPTPSEPHELTFPFTIRAGIGAWKLLNMSRDWAISVSESDPQLLRGRYLAEAVAHCGECHTPRTFSQGLDVSRWFAGAPNPSGRGTIPNITPAKLDWSQADILSYLQTGFRPDFDVAGGGMADVIDGLKTLPEKDLEAITAYVKAVPAAE